MFLGLHWALWGGEEALGPTSQVQWSAPSLLCDPLRPGFPGCLQDRDHPLSPHQLDRIKGWGGPPAQVALLAAVGKGPSMSSEGRLRPWPVAVQSRGENRPTLGAESKEEVERWC